VSQGRSQKKTKISAVKKKIIYRTVFGGRAQTTKNRVLISGKMLPIIVDVLAEIFEDYMRSSLNRGLLSDRLIIVRSRTKKKENNFIHSRTIKT